MENIERVGKVEDSCQECGKECDDCHGAGISGTPVSK